MRTKHQFFDGSKYHITVILIYVVGFSYLLVRGLVPKLSWSLDDTNLYNMLCFLVLSLGVLCGVSAALGERVRFKKYEFSTFLPLILYALMFAVAEEIIFRGVIQTKLYWVLESYFLPVVVSSLIYALAHILNDATSLKPRGWNWRLVMKTFVAGLFLGAAYLNTGSLVLPVAIHAVLIITNQIFIRSKSR